jgi:hypothetical protein
LIAAVGTATSKLGVYTFEAAMAVKKPLLGVEDRRV